VRELGKRQVAHAHQFKRANRSLRKLKTYLGRVIRDIERRIVGNEDLREAFVRPARRVLEQERRQRGRKVYSLHAPEVECIGKAPKENPATGNAVCGGVPGPMLWGAKGAAGATLPAVPCSVSCASGHVTTAESGRPVSMSVRSTPLWGNQN
jgi:hypothetical protein